MKYTKFKYRSTYKTVRETYEVVQIRVGLEYL